MRRPHLAGGVFACADAPFPAIGMTGRGSPPGLRAIGTLTP